jgi:hypothetical protein
MGALLAMFEHQNERRCTTHVQRVFDAPIANGDADALAIPAEHGCSTFPSNNKHRHGITATLYNVQTTPATQINYFNNGAKHERRVHHPMLPTKIVRIVAARNRRRMQAPLEAGSHA